MFPNINQEVMYCTLEDQSKCNNSPYKVQVSGTKKIGLDVFWDNNLMFVNQKPYYRVFLSFHKYTYTDALNSVKHLLNFYVDTPKGLVEIEAASKDDFFEGTNKYFLLTGTTHKSVFFNIPAEYVVNNLAKMSIVVGSVINSTKSLTENKYAINIDTTPRVVQADSKNGKEFMELNRFPAYFDINSNKVFNNGIGKNLLTYTVSYREYDLPNRLDKKYVIVYKYKLANEWEKNDDKASERLDNLALNLVSRSNIEMQTFVINSKDYYDVDKFTYNYHEEENRITATAKIRTSLNEKTQKVNEDFFGDEGVIINPISKHKETLKTLVSVGGLIFEIDDTSFANKTNRDLQSVKELKFEPKLSYELTYLKNEWNEIKDIDIQKGMDFINERQKETS